MSEKSLNYWIENKQSLRKVYDRLHSKLLKTLNLLSDCINERLSSSVQNIMIKGRVKEFEAFYRKLLEKCMEQIIEEPFKAINDLLGLRIVVPFLEDVQQVENLIKSSHEIINVKYKYQELSIKEFGYDSTHLIIELPPDICSKANISEKLLCEIQLRTILQDAWAEVEHELVYKTKIDKVETAIRRKLVALNATLSLADITFQEIRDYQRKKLVEIEERHSMLLDKVSTIPEKRAGISSKSGKTPVSSINEIGTPLTEMDNSLNDMVIEAVNAHINNNLERALELYTQLLVISPNHYLYNHRGLVYFSLSRYENALEDFNRAIELISNDIRVYTNRGLTYRMLKNYESALKDFNKSLELNPLWPDTFYGRSLTNYDMGNINAALEDCDRAIALKPNFKQAVRFKQFLLNQSVS
ncbi:MAG: tetratricopeptide repeat protein [Spirochaetes bacterium]|nr:tetratricopeptide repeat protein [Spirochaetota bacterium]